MLCEGGRGRRERERERERERKGGRERGKDGAMKLLEE